MADGLMPPGVSAAELERLLVDRFGPDFREKVFVGPLGSFRLADAFEECGLEDPRAPASRNPSSGLPAVWQMPRIPLPLSPLAPADQLRAAMARYIAERQMSSWREVAEAGAARWRRYVTDSTRWPLSPAPRSPHGDPLISQPKGVPE